MSARSSDDVVDMFERLVSDRRTCRKFLARNLPPAEIDRILLLAQQTPSWCNTQPWNVVVTSGTATHSLREGLLSHIDSGASVISDVEFPQSYEDAHHRRRRECGAQLYASVGIGRHDSQKRSHQMRQNFEFFGAPHVAIVTAPKALGPYGLVDCGLYIGTFLLAIEACGYAAAAQAALAQYSEFLREHLEIADDRLVVAGISFGHPDLSHPVNQFRTTRCNLKSVVTIRS